MTLAAKDVMPLWWSLIVRYCLYTSGPYLLIGGLGHFFHDVLSPDYIGQHRNLVTFVRGAWDATASVLALKQAIRIHLPRIITSYSGDLN